MTAKAIRSAQPLRDVLYEFSLAAEKPDAALLDDFVRRYPDYAAELTDFAVEWMVDVNRPKLVATADVTQVSPAVSRAISKYQDALHARGATATCAADVQAGSVSCESPFVGLDRKGFRALAEKLNVSRVFLCKLRDCVIDPKTMSDGFRRYVADRMSVSVDRLASYLSEAAPRLGHQFYKADQKPETTARQSFEEAVRSSDLSQDQQDFLLGL